MAREYNTTGFGSDPLHQTNNSPSSILGGIDDLVGSFLFGNPDASSVIFGELLGYNSQQREFEQQEYLLDKMNEYNTPANQMARMKEAGINLNTAAAGIAQGGNESAQAPAVSNNTAGAANGLNAVTSGFGNVASGIKSLAEAAFSRGTKNATIEKLEAEASESFSNAGLSSVQSEIAGVTLKYADDNQILDMQTKRVNIKRVAQEYKNLKVQHDNLIAQYDEIIANTSLLYSEKEVQDAMKAKIDEETRWQKADNDFWENHHFLRNSNSNDAIIADLIAAGIDPEPYMSKWIDYAGRYHGAVVEAEQESNPL